ncbi:MAG: hypothetical protein J07HQW2_02175 [Haloquadratum walsbyi J07HQW2]|jgi:hypothetical protein|uniref:Glycosyltransferase n=1 Tax=Haloquadratum walsbyi J07HQW2 TaxID=1238425 RepID=U1NF67_9EURY|nr:MAG: hypothetical protein J07HQW2_02175 [Haloquadratum walsbyi J07HQW2]
MAQLQSLTTDRTGFITDPTADALAQQLTDCLTDETTLTQVSTHAHSYGEAHAWDRIVTELEEAYSSAMSTDA